MVIQINFSFHLPRTEVSQLAIKYANDFANTETAERYSPFISICIRTFQQSDCTEIIVVLNKNTVLLHMDSKS